MRVWKFGDNIDTDAIIPGRFLIYNDPKELALHAFEGTRDEFAKKVSPGDIIVGGKNFGCGSSREHAPLAIIGSGVKYVIAESFARIFYRNSINTGLLPLVCTDASTIPDGAQLQLQLENNRFIVEGNNYRTEPVPDFLRTISEAGGLVPYARKLERVI